MAIAAEPFQFLDKQTHNPITDLSGIFDSSLLNTAQNGLTAVSSAVKNLVGSIKDKIAALGAPLDAIKQLAGNIKSSIMSGIDTVQGIIRNVKNGISSLKDLAQAGMAALEDAIFNMLPSGVSRSAITSLARRCKEAMASQNVLGNPWDTDAQCGSGGKSGCTKSSLTNILNSLTGGAYNSAWRDANSLLMGLVGMTNLSYKANMCGVFGALLGNIGGQLGTPQIARAAGSVIGSLGLTGNLLGLADMSKNIQGFNVKEIVPQALNDMSRNVGFFSEKNIANISERGLAGYELVDDKWNLSNDSSFFSNRNFTNPSEGFTKVLQANTLSNKISDLNSFDTSPISTAFSQAKSGVSSFTSSISSSFGKLFA